MRSQAKSLRRHETRSKIRDLTRARNEEPTVEGTKNENKWIPALVNQARNIHKTLEPAACPNEGTNASSDQQKSRDEYESSA